MINDNLQGLGLTLNEIKAYLALLELGEATVANIAKKSGIKRTTAYLVVDSLKEKGFLSELKKRKKTFFYAEDPRELEEKMEERKILLQKTIPELLAIANLLDKKPKITFYEGIEGIKDVYRDTLHYPEKEMLAWVSEEAFNVLDEDFVNYYIPERVKKKIWVRVIAPGTEKMQSYKEEELKVLRKTKLIDAKSFPIKVEIDLYGNNKIGIMAFEEKISLIIESEKIYITLKSIFESQWNLLPEK